MTTPSSSIRHLLAELGSDAPHVPIGTSEPEGVVLTLLVSGEVLTRMTEGAMLALQVDAKDFYTVEGGMDGSREKRPVGRFSVLRVDGSLKPGRP